MLNTLEILPVLCYLCIGKRNATLIANTALARILKMRLFSSQQSSALALQSAEPQRKEWITAILHQHKHSN